MSLTHHNAALSGSPEGSFVPNLGIFMTTRHRLLAAGSTAALAAGGLFFTAAPATAAPTAECLTAQAQFLAALELAGVNADIVAELDLALDDVLTAQAALDALVDGQGGITGELQVKLTAALAVLGTEEGQAQAAGIALQLAVDAIAKADKDVINAQLALDTAVDVLDAEGPALQVIIDDLVIIRDDAADDVVEAELAVQAAAVTPGTEDDVLAAGVLADAKVALATAEGNLDTVEAKLAVLVGAVTTAEGVLTAALAAQVKADAVDIAALEATLALELGQFQAALKIVDDLEAQLILAGDLDAITEATANLNAALAVLVELQVALDATAVDVTALEALFDASISACGVGGGTGTVVVDIDIVVAVGTGTGTGTGTGVVVPAVTGGGTGGGQTSNRGMNVQTAAGTEAAGAAEGLGLAGLLAAGLGITATAFGIRRRAQRS